jgi:hypothetical protein
LTLKVIGTGFGRTGTLSLKLALEKLGQGPCYHMIETIAHPEHDALWLALASGKRADWRPILDGYAATVDWPGIMIWEELAAAYPDAKIILTTRDPEAWYMSAAATIFTRMTGALLPAEDGTIDPMRQCHLAMVRCVVAERSFGGCLDKDHALAVFAAHNAKVRASVPPERLLVHEAAQGWAPLCAFLGVGVPATPYPKANSAEEFRSHFPERR